MSCLVPHGARSAIPTSLYYVFQFSFFILSFDRSTPCIRITFSNFIKLHAEPIQAHLVSDTAATHDAPTICTWKTLATTALHIQLVNQGHCMTSKDCAPCMQLLGMLPLGSRWQACAGTSSLPGRHGCSRKTVHETCVLDFLSYRALLSQNKLAELFTPIMLKTQPWLIQPIPTRFWNSPTCLQITLCPSQCSCWQIACYIMSNTLQSCVLLQDWPTIWAC